MDRKNIDDLPAPFVASVAHYNMVRIHPFDDGNGRGARILMNLILMHKRFVPAVIRNEERQNYYAALRLADNGNLMPFIQLMTQCLIETQESILKDFQA
ncbi:MAG: Fic family protein [Pseudomonadota bacterium]